MGTREGIRSIMVFLVRMCLLGCCVLREYLSIILWSFPSIGLHGCGPLSDRRLLSSH